MPAVSATDAAPSELGLAAWARVRPDVKGMHAYAVQDARGLLKLDAMENPYGLSPALQAALGADCERLAKGREGFDFGQALLAIRRAGGGPCWPGQWLTDLGLMALRLRVSAQVAF